VALGAVAVLLEVSDVKPVSRFNCWREGVWAEQFGGRERVWNDETGKCDYGFREYR
jgi:hypothetical protein